MAESEKNPTNTKPSAEALSHELLLRLNEQLMSLLTELLKLVRDKAAATPGAVQVPATNTKVDLKAALAELEQNTTVRKDGDKKEFLLHHATVDHEYADGMGGPEFETKAETKWLARAEMAEHDAKQSSNPMVSCWIPESAIMDIPSSGNAVDAQIPTQTPQQYKFVVMVKPGKYQVYQEIKQ
jgi:hypothetical protein